MLIICIEKFKVENYELKILSEFKQKMDVWVSCAINLEFGLEKTRALGGWMGGWMGAKAGLRIAYSNQKMPCKTVQLLTADPFRCLC